MVRTYHRPSLPEQTSFNKLEISLSKHFLEISQVKQTSRVKAAPSRSPPKIWMELAENWHSHLSCHPPPQGQKKTKNKLHTAFLFHRTVLGCWGRQYLPPLATTPEGITSPEEEKLAVIYTRLFWNVMCPRIRATMPNSEYGTVRREIKSEVGQDAVNTAASIALQRGSIQGCIVTPEVAHTSSKDPKQVGIGVFLADVKVCLNKSGIIKQR